MSAPEGDGVALTSVAHPRPPWWQRPWSWLQCHLVAADVSEESLETIEMEVPEGMRVPYEEDPRPAWPLRAWYWLRNWRARRTAAQYTVIEEDIEEVEDLTDYDEVSSKYAEALLRSRRSSRLLIGAMVLKGWTSDEIHHYIETGEEPEGKELE